MGNSGNVRRKRMASLCLFTFLIARSLLALAEPETDQAKIMAKEAQNPVADLISVPFQNNTNFNVGGYGRTQNVLNIQPVIPVHLSRSWNLITRTIMPLIWQPTMSSGGYGQAFGLGDINPTFFFSPAAVGASKLIFGIGPTFLLPTATNPVLGTGKWSAGPAAVILMMPGNWVFGALANNVWSFAGDANRASVNQMTVQPFVNYNFSKGWYLTSSPIITANWRATAGNLWTLPLGGGVGKIIRIDRLPINMQLSGYYNVLTPDVSGGKWTLRAQVQFLFPS